MSASTTGQIDESGCTIPLSPGIWETVDPVVRALIVHLIEENGGLRAHIEALEERLKTNSSNSSRPPSLDPPGTPRRRKKPSGRRRGGQKGHKGHHREFLPEKDVTAVHDYYPEECGNCGHHFTKAEKPRIAPARKQVIEIPPIKPEVHEHRQHYQECPICHRVTMAELPEGVPTGAFGPRVMSLIALLAGRYRISRRDVEELLQDVLNIRISLGCVKRIEELVSKSLAPSVDEAAKEIQQSPVVNMDETGWKEENKRCYLWNANTPNIAVYRITAHRNRETAREILGEEFKGTLGTDRFSAYFFQTMKKWQICLAHVSRNLQKIAERSGPSKHVGERATAELDRVFDIWGNFKDGKIDRTKMQQDLMPIRARMGRVLKQGAECGHSKTENTCQNLRVHFKALWTFALEDGVEPTNNSSEQALRPGVRWRRVSFGTQSKAGSRFVERMLTAIETCRRQSRNALDFLSDSVNALFGGKTPPSLLAKPGG